QVQDPRPRLCASAGDGFSLQGPHAGRRLRHPWLARHRVRGGGSMSGILLRNVFTSSCNGEVDRQSEATAVGWGSPHLPRCFLTPSLTLPLSGGGKSRW